MLVESQNLGQDICGLFRVLTQFDFTARKHTKCLELKGTTQPTTQQANFDSCHKIAKNQL